MKNTTYIYGISMKLIYTKQSLSSWHYSLENGTCTTSAHAAKLQTLYAELYMNRLLVLVTNGNRNPKGH